MAFTAPERDVDRVFLHCSASDHAHHDDVEVMRDWHVNGNGWSDVGYHFFIKKDGTVQAGRPLDKTPAAQGGNNTGTIAICLHGLAVERFTKAQYQSVIDLCSEIDAAYGGLVTFHGHCEVAAKACPVFPYREVLGLDEHGAPTFAPTVSPSTSDAADAATTARPPGRPAAPPPDGEGRRRPQPAGAAGPRRPDAGGRWHLRPGHAHGGQGLPEGQGP